MKYICTMDKKIFELKIKIGMLRDLYAQGLISRGQMEQAIKKLEGRQK